MTLLPGYIYRGRVYHDSCHPNEMLSGRHSNQPVTYGPVWYYRPACHKCKVMVEVNLDEISQAPCNSLPIKTAVTQNDRLGIIIRFAFGSFSGSYWYEVATFVDYQFSHTELWCDCDFEVCEE